MKIAARSKSLSPIRRSAAPQHALPPTASRSKARGAVLSDEHVASIEPLLTNVTEVIVARPLRGTVSVVVRVFALRLLCMNACVYVRMPTLRMYVAMLSQDSVHAERRTLSKCLARIAAFSNSPGASNAVQLVFARRQYPPYSALLHCCYARLLRCCNHYV